MSTNNGRCQPLLAELSGIDATPWTLELVEDLTTVIGSVVKGPGRLERPGVESTHASVRRDRYGIKVRPFDGGNMFLNSNPLTAQGEIALICGDRVRMGNHVIGVDLIVTCSGELAAAQAELRNQEDGQRELASAKKPASNGHELAGARKGKPACGSGLQSLTPAEYEIVSWMGRGVQDLNEIAERLFRSVNTVRTQLNRIYDKLEVHSKAELCSLIIRNWLNHQCQSHPLQRFAGTCECWGK